MFATLRPMGSLSPMLLPPTRLPPSSSAALRGHTLLVAWSLSCIVSSSCGGGACSGGSDRPQPIASDVAQTIVLPEIPFAELSIPDQVRPGGEEPPTRIALHGPWRYTGTTRKEMHKYVTPLPIRPRGLFFQRALPGMRLETAQGEEVRYDRFGKSKSYMWSHDRTELIVYSPTPDNPPDDSSFILQYPPATLRERQLNWLWSALPEQTPLPKEQFVWTTIQDDWDNRRGLLLPAPGMASWDITIPAAGELHFASGIVEPEVRVGAPSDGGSIRVEIEVAGTVHPLAAIAVSPGTFEMQHVDLSAFAGQQVRLRVFSEPGAKNDYDYIFLAEPSVSSRKSDPVRVVMVFIDTLRPDHMSLYGYERDTTAAIDHLRKEAAVFTNARSVAPWTLPSARSIVTGRQPEHYGSVPTIQEILRKRGWATGFIAGNVYLSFQFDMHRDWEFHRVGLWPLAEDSTTDALQWLDDHEGRDGLLQVHYMSTHLPYAEPKSYRRMYAGEPAAGLREEFHLSDVRKPSVVDDPEGRKYVQDRYDNNVRYVTDQVQRIIDVLDDNDILVLYADHGEEFWDHGGFEHGHTLYDELLHVPLLIDGPGIESASIDTPVSLLDIVPTLLDMLGVPKPEGLAEGSREGLSLLPLLAGDAAAEQSLRQRDLAFGRPLYGTERWGVMHGSEKWSTFEGKEFLFDLDSDPGEKKNQLKGQDLGGEPYHEMLKNALGREVSAAYRLLPTDYRGQGATGLWALCTVPGGFSQAFRSDDPLENSAVTVERISDPQQLRALLTEFQFTDQDHTISDDMGGAKMCWHPGWEGSREVYLSPARPLAEVGHQMVCSAYLGDDSGGTRGTMRIPQDRDPTLAGPRNPALAKLSLEKRQLLWQYGIAPVHSAALRELSGRDTESTEMLQFLGYIEEGETDEHDSALPPCEPPATKLTP